MDYSMEQLHNKQTKQVIVFRKDLLKGDNAIRKGKFAAQCCHASLGALLKFFNKYKCLYPNEQTTTRYEVEFGQDCVLEYWLNGLFTKVCLSVENEDELKEIERQCNELNIPCALIVDSGLTEFHGVPTTTCLGIGPYWSEDIDKITGNLKLL